MPEHAARVHAVRPMRPAAPALAAALLGLAFLPSASAAQERSVLMFLPTDGRTLEMGGEHAGALSASDHLAPDDAFLEAWELTGAAGTDLTIDLVSDDFDPMLYVVGPGLSETLFDDDGGPGCNSRVRFTILENGSFRVVASSLGARQAGTYTLRVSSVPGSTATYGCGEADPAALLALPLEGRTLRMGSTSNGQLGPLSPTVQEGRPAQAWTLEGSAGDEVAIVMESAAFDSFLYLVGGGLEAVMTDDDGGGDLHARLQVTLPSDGPYTVVASSVSEGASGGYAISVEAPVDPATLPTAGRTIAVGQTLSGVLGFGEPVVLEGRIGQAWALEGTAGQRIAVELSSEDFDSYLYIVGPGIPEPLSDDDGAGELDARIEVTLPESGSYRVIVSALGTDARGAFTLAVSER